MTIRKLLLSLQEHNVRFLVIGAWAFPAHGYVRNTVDIDIFIKPTRPNTMRTIEALKAIGYDVVDEADVSIFLNTKVLIREYVLQTDIHPFVKGLTFEEGWANKVETTISEVKVFVPSLDHVIRMKEAAGRAKDKFDLIQLKKLKKIRTRQTKQ